MIRPLTITAPLPGWLRLKRTCGHQQGTIDIHPRNPLHLLIYANLLQGGCAAVESAACPHCGSLLRIYEQVDDTLAECTADACPRRRITRSLLALLTLTDEEAARFPPEVYADEGQ